MPQSSPSERTRRWLACLAVAAAAVLVHSGSLPGPFVFDDVPGIVHNPNIRSLWPPWRALDAPPGTGASGRPVEALTLAIDHALWGLDPRGFRATGLVLHALAAVFLLLAVRRGLRLAGREALALPVAFAVALLWAVHPLQGDALHQPIYRNETLAALFWFLATWSALRAFAGERRFDWPTAVVASALAMGSKEIAVSLPLFLLSLDRLLVAGSFRAALRSRPRGYAALFATWIVLALSIASGDRGVTVGFEHQDWIGPWESLCTQAGVLLLYARLTFWPHPLNLDYGDWPLETGLENVWPAALTWLVLLLLAVRAFARNRAAGVLGLTAFAILAPTSSFIPLAGAPAAEHRMALPLAPLLVLLCLLAVRAGALLPARARRPIAAVLLVALAATFGGLSYARGRVYRSAEGVWLDSLTKRPRNARGWLALGIARRNAGDLDGAEDAYRRALALKPNDASAWNNLAELLVARGRLPEAEAALSRALRAKPDHVGARVSRANVLVELGRLDEARREYEEALARDPTHVLARRRLAWLLATAPDPALRDGEAALRHAREAVRLKENPATLDTLAAALAETGEFAEAARTARRALERARAEGRADAARRIEEHLSAYERGMPWREAP